MGNHSKAATHQLSNVKFFEFYEKILHKDAFFHFVQMSYCLHCGIFRPFKYHSNIHFLRGYRNYPGNFLIIMTSYHNLTMFIIVSYPESRYISYITGYKIFRVTLQTGFKLYIGFDTKLQQKQACSDVENALKYTAQNHSTHIHIHLSESE